MQFKVKEHIVQKLKMSREKSDSSRDQVDKIYYSYLLLKLISR